MAAEGPLPEPENCLSFYEKTSSPTICRVGVERKIHNKNTHGSGSGGGGGNDVNSFAFYMALSILHSLGLEVRRSRFSSTTVTSSYYIVVLTD